MLSTGESLNEKDVQATALNDGFRAYILYDVNMQEGFNLRRDVLTRMMLLVHKLNLGMGHRYCDHFRVRGT